MTRATRRYHQLRQAGMCVNCADEPAMEARPYCVGCQEERDQRRRNPPVVSRPEPVRTVANPRQRRFVTLYPPFEGRAVTYEIVFP